MKLVENFVCLPRSHRFESLRKRIDRSVQEIYGFEGMEMQWQTPRRLLN
jgi:hypothetical protein